MSGHRDVNELLRPIMDDPARRAQVEEEKRIMDAILILHELREKMGVSQEELARALAASQANVSRTEHKGDLYVSTIGKYVEALGGTLELHAVFPDQTIRLDFAAPDKQVGRIEEDPVRVAVR